jgi:site-specific recombinase XerD
MVAGNDLKMLVEGIMNYLAWIKAVEEHRGRPLHLRYRNILVDFLIFTIRKDVVWHEMFTLKTLEDFQAYSSFKGCFPAIKALSEFLFSQGKIKTPLQTPRLQMPLPDIFEEYLHYRRSRFGDDYPVRRVLRLFDQYLKERNLGLSTLNIEILDAFLKTFKVAQITRRLYRYILRGFLKYLYYERKLIKRDLAPLLVGPATFAQSKPPKFLRPQQVQQLFSSFNLSKVPEIRTYAMIHLAYGLGLRPVEISRITLDDISFRKQELTIRDRKGANPVTLPLPEKTLKAVALYLKKARPKSLSRHLFLRCQFPYKRTSASAVIQYISKAMKKAGLPGSSYWLRHTYAQNLLEIGRSIYEVKEMMGHQNIQSTQRYLHIDNKLMRKVLFDEEL